RYLVGAAVPVRRDPSRLAVRSQLRAVGLGRLAVLVDRPLLLHARRVLPPARPQLREVGAGVGHSRLAHLPAARAAQRAHAHGDGAALPARLGHLGADLARLPRIRPAASRALVGRDAAPRARQPARAVAGDRLDLGAVRRLAAGDLRGRRASRGLRSEGERAGGVTAISVKTTWGPSAAVNASSAECFVGNGSGPKARSPAGCPFERAYLS